MGAALSHRKITSDPTIPCRYGLGALLTGFGGVAILVGKLPVLQVREPVCVQGLCASLCARPLWAGRRQGEPCIGAGGVGAS